MARSSLSLFNQKNLVRLTFPLWVDGAPFGLTPNKFVLSLQDLNRGDLSPPLSHIDRNSMTIGSHVDGSDRNSMTVGSHVDGSDPSRRLGSFAKKPLHFVKLICKSNPHLDNFMKTPLKLY
jgi:hypothetical protein